MCSCLAAIYHGHNLTCALLLNTEGSKLVAVSRYIITVYSVVTTNSSNNNDDVGGRITDLILVQRFDRKAWNID